MGGKCLKKVRDLIEHIHSLRLLDIKVVVTLQRAKLKRLRCTIMGSQIHMSVRGESFMNIDKNER